MRPKPASEREPIGHPTLPPPRPRIASINRIGESFGAEPLKAPQSTRTAMKLALHPAQSIPLIALVTAIGCGERSPHDAEPSIGQSVSAVAPAGSAATIVSNNVPTTLAPGERLVVEIVTQNTGTVDWDPASEWALRSDVWFGWYADFVDAPVAQGASTTHKIRVTAPAASRNFVAEVFSFVPGETGAVPGGSLIIPVTIDAGATPNWSCTAVSTTLPASLNPNESANVDVTVQNTGTQTWPGGDELCLYAREDKDSTDPNFQRWGNAFCIRLASAVAPGNTTTFSLPITAPSTPGTYRFMRQILDTRSVEDDGVGFFNNTEFCVDETVTVATTSTPLAATITSEDMSTTVAPSDLFEVNVTVENTGTETWTPGDFFLYSLNSPINVWGPTVVSLPTTVANGESVTFTFPVRVPDSVGSETFRWRMLKSGESLFGDEINKTVVIDAGATPVHASSLVSEAFPATIAPSTSQSVTVTLRNEGTQTWLGDGSYGLVTTNDPFNLWTITFVPLTQDVPQNSNVTFTVPVTAPATEGGQFFEFRMNQSSLGRFGVEINEAVNVTSASTPPLDADVSSQVVPATMLSGSTQTLSITMENTGTDSWPAGGAITLRSTNTPFQLWTTGSAPVPTLTANGETVTFTFDVAAPDTPGSYNSEWRMHDGTTYFGDTATTPVTVTANPCGNGTIDSGETCDDGGRDPGDGCNESCQIENQLVDLATTGSDRTFLGFIGNRQLSSVRIADLDGDGSAEVFMSDFTDIQELGVVRNVAGRVYVYTGGAGFFDQTTSAVNASPLITIWGRDEDDWLGSLTGGVRVGDVTDDGNLDIVVGAPQASGTDEANFRSGEIYILKGGAELYAGGIFDLRNSGVAGTNDVTNVLGNTIAGAAADDRLSVIAVGDVTNDGIADVIAGAVRNDANGNNSGAVYVIAGGTGLAATSTVELGSASIAARILGPGADAGLGRAAAVGDITGDGINDLVVSAPTQSSNGRTFNGEVYVLPGPVSGTIDLSGAFTGLTIVGENFWVNYGADLAIADVGDTGTLDLIVGAPQALTSGLQVGEVHVWYGPLATSGTIDNAVVEPAGIIHGSTKDLMGSAVEAADTNGDGLSDVLFGVGSSDGPADVRSGSGEAGIVLGQTSWGTTAWSPAIGVFRIYGEALGDFLGLNKDSVAAGDIDGDGRADWCVGAQLGGDSVSSAAGRIDCFQSPW